jgi:hypothetical protein
MPIPVAGRRSHVLWCDPKQNLIRRTVKPEGKNAAESAKKDPKGRLTRFLLNLKQKNLN